MNLTFTQAFTQLTIFIVLGCLKQLLIEIKQKQKSIKVFLRVKGSFKRPVALATYKTQCLFFCTQVLYHQPTFQMLIFARHYCDRIQAVLGLRRSRLTLFRSYERTS